MSAMPVHSPALEPEDLDRYFLERANMGDDEGVVALYEPAAALAFPVGTVTVGADQIRRVYSDLFAAPPRFDRQIRPPVRHGDLAITSTTRPGNGGGGPASSGWNMAVGNRPTRRFD